MLAAAKTAAYFSCFSMEYEPGPTSKRERTAIARDGRFVSLYLLDRPIPKTAKA